MTRVQNTLLPCLLILLFSGQALALDIMLPEVYDNNISVVGWLMSEKLDGVRAYWDGTRLLSKNGNSFQPPSRFLHNLPPFPLEGELWGGHGTFEQTVAAVKKQQPHNGWLSLQFAIFDVPKANGSFSERIQSAVTWFNTHPSRFSHVIPQQLITDPHQLQVKLKRIEELGGEGLIVRNPESLYKTGRSRDILKIKNFYDAEAVVIDHIPGKGRNRGRLGALLVHLVDDKDIIFKIGTGFTDAERDNPPPPGTIITFKFYGYYASGIPKFPSYMRIRSDYSLSR